METNPINKKQLRKEILKKRNKLLLPETNEPTAEKRFLDQCITAHLIIHDLKDPCDNYLCYVNYKSEVDTTQFIGHLLSHGKHVYVPKVLGSEMDFFEIHSLSELVLGYQNIPEPPDSNASPLILQQDMTYRMILPGSVFDICGNRIGYGGGYYDKYLSKCIQHKISVDKIAIAYDLQITEQIPTDPYDVPMDYIYTEKGNIL